MSGDSKSTGSSASSLTKTGNTVAEDWKNIQPSLCLNSKNYLKWSQFVRTFLKGKGKLSHLLGIGPDSKDLKFAAWDEKDSMVMSWLWNSMMPEVSDTCMFLTTTKDIWETYRQTYSKVRDAAQIYEIKMKISTTKQGGRSVTEYAQNLQNLWQELDHYQCMEMKCTDNAALLKCFMEKDRIYTFLAGLNADFDPVRVQVLGKELPSLNEAIAIIRGDEGRRGVMMESKLVEGSALAANNTNFRGMKPDQQYSSHSDGARGDSGLFDNSKGSNKDSIWCTYCKKQWHSRDRCWKFHGKPSNAQNSSQITSRNWAMKGSQGVGQGQAHMTLAQSGGGDSSQERAEFNREDIEKLRNLLGTLEKSTGSGTCSFAFSDKDRDFFLFDLDLPSSPSSYVIPKDSFVSESPNESSVYSRRKGPTAQPMPVLDSEPNPSADSVEVISNSESHENDVPVVDDEDLPITIRKGVRECTRQPMYPLSHFTGRRHPSLSTSVADLNCTQSVPSHVTPLLSDLDRISPSSSITSTTPHTSSVALQSSVWPDPVQISAASPPSLASAAALSLTYSFFSFFLLLR
ncbi:hypothetical protein EZV62_004637 [Acer yangbiense]|uniref:Uncharacterized protein n=1 Tax=Acer yangbiense TaxID=1000413 RepID=A0A5C7IM94_9ROSI|nr:hypothetical protein EZV62_004637 [Acer yangbiense]